MKAGLTPRQAECPEVIRSFIESNAYSPSFEEIRVALGLGQRSGVHRIVHLLVDRGWITMTASTDRSIALVGDRVELPAELVSAIRNIIDEQVSMGWPHLEDVMKELGYG